MNTQRTFKGKFIARPRIEFRTMAWTKIIAKSVHASVLKMIFAKDDILNCFVYGGVTIFVFKKGI